MKGEAGALPRRLFADDYSATGQLAWASGGEGEPFVDPGSEDRPEWWKQFVGQLRFDALLFRRLVVPDSHVLDGTFFATLAPKQLRVALARREADLGDPVVPVELRLRERTVAQTLATFLVVEETRHLRRFEFKTIVPKEARVAVADGLAQRSEADLEGYLSRHRDVEHGGQAEAIADLLADCLHETGREWAGAAASIERLRDGWRKWCEQEGCAKLTYERYRPNVDFHPARAALYEPLDRVRDGLTGAPAKALNEVFGALERGEPSRSTITELLRPYRASGDEEKIEEIDAWVSRVRYRAIAHQHRARFVQRWMEGQAAFGELRHLHEETMSGARGGGDAEVPEDVVAGLASMEPEDWALFCGNHRSQLGRWWDHGEFRAFKEVAAGLATVLKPSPSYATPLKIALPPAGALLMGVPGAAAGATVAHAASAYPRWRCKRRIVDHGRSVSGGGRARGG